MKKFIPLLLSTLLLTACARGHYPDAPATPADIPPPTDLLSKSS